jgi:hypothetical protein
VGPAAVEFFYHAGRDDGQGDELGVAVFQRGAGRDPVVFEDENVAEAQILPEIDHAVAIGPEDVLDFFRRQIGEAFLVAW